MTKQAELFPELGPQQLQPTGRVTFELVPETEGPCVGCAFEYLIDCSIPSTACAKGTMYRLVGDA